MNTDIPFYNPFKKCAVHDDFKSFNFLHLSCSFSHTFSPTYFYTTQIFYPLINKTRRFFEIKRTPNTITIVSCQHRIQG
ncbi:hypothetical protein HanIR_Chr16g0813071 [Helianthus annuus]|nr:hypothetical protein HanIR_Chr16g0813071 [Helianthus annuus]